MTAAMESYLKSRLSGALSSDQVNALMKSTAKIATLPQDMQALVGKTLADGFLLRMRITTAFSAVQFFAIGLLWGRKQLYLKE